MKSTIRFSAKFLRTEADVLALPKTASAKLPSHGLTNVEGIINGLPFQTALEPNGKASHGLRMNKAMQKVAGNGATLAVEITRVGEEPETRMPTELQKALAATPPAQALWAEITPNARRDWIYWIISAKQRETRTARVEKACDMLASGKRRVCCFGGINWLMKNHAKADKK
jgi:hypothetical protein